MFRQRKSFYIRLTMFIVLISTVPVLIVGVFSYIRASDTLQENVHTEKIQSVYQSQLNIEQTLKTADHSLSYFVNSSFLKSVLKEPMYATQFQLLNELKQEMNHLQTFDIGLEEVLLVSLREQWVIDSFGFRRLTNEQTNTFRKAYTDYPADSVWILEDPEWLGYKIDVEQQCSLRVNLVKMVPANANQKSGLAIASFPACRLLTLDLDTQKEAFFILDENQKVIDSERLDVLNEAYENPTELYELITEKSQVSKTGQFSVEKEMGDYTITYRKSLFNNWIYVSFISNQELTKDSSAIGVFTLTICLTVILIVLFFGWFGSRRIYRPVRDLNKTILATLSPLKAKQANIDEFAFFNEHIFDMRDKHNQLLGELNGQMEQLRHLFIVNLVQGHLSSESIQQRMSSLNYPEQWTSFCLFAMQIDTLKGTTYTSKDKDLLLLTMNRLVQEQIPDDVRLTPMVNKHTLVLVLAATEAENTNASYETIAKELIALFKEDFGISVSIGQSAPYTNLANTREAYEEGVEALKHRVTHGKEAVIPFVTIERDHIYFTHYPQKQVHLVMEAIRNGNLKETEDHLYTTIKEIVSTNQHPNQNHISLMRLLNDIIQLMHRMGIDYFEVNSQNTLFDSLFQLHDTDAIYEWFHVTLIAPLVLKINERSSEQYKNISEQIIHMIQEKYDTDITLESIADELHYHPNYLSSMFRKETGLSFTEYLTSFRLSVAKKWLMTSKMPIREIAEKLRYGNSQNFIRSFKKKEGMTPGKYRDSHTELPPDFI
ncbi:AraC family transcriptional regulator [Aureibacillus halotolerans]|uniref:AraC family transcriptional regulator n=1 Tax=Aureibacillus halotolerans TaxID=1508390 RepID=A0A4R6UCS5_9BACI|nr:helix-turn-helix domain-containing protein [Aureibacillus halotolerans]TDQ42933.1 AraC family transcriptional regulator [Aureibacillus halotolerans]